MGYNITSAEQIIDAAAIKGKLETLRVYVNNFNSAADNVEEASIICTPEAFQVGENVLNEPLASLADEMHQTAQIFLNYIDDLDEATDWVYNEQMSSYHEYKREQEEIRRQQEEQARVERANAQKTQSENKTSGITSN